MHARGRLATVRLAIERLATRRRWSLRISLHAHTATFTRFKRAELTITESELRAIAAAAMIGLR